LSWLSIAPFDSPVVPDVQNGSQIPRPALDVGEFTCQGVRRRHQAAAGVAVEGKHPRLDIREFLLACAVANKHGRLGIVEKIVDLGTRIGGVERQENRAGSHRGPARTVAR
jgi:hypothetical protein